MRDLYMNIRMAGKFVMWLLRKVIGRRNFIVRYWLWGVEVYEDRDPGLMAHLIIMPVALMAIVGITQGLFYHYSGGEFIMATVIFSVLWNVSLFLGIAWKSFIKEYEQSFTRLRDFKED
jgi:hypothetical protein